MKPTNNCEVCKCTLQETTNVYYNHVAESFKYNVIIIASFCLYALEGEGRDVIRGVGGGLGGGHLPPPEFEK